MTVLAQPDAERALLGACQSAPAKLFAAASIVRAEDFSLDSARKLWVTMLDMASEQKPLDLVSLAEELGRRKWLNAVGGWAYLSDLTTHAAVGSVEHHAKVIVDRARRRQLLAACEAGKLAVEDASETTAACLALVHERLLEIAGRTAEMAAAQPLAEFAAHALVEMREQAQREGLVGLPTGIASLDRMTGGLRAGELWVVGALPGRGKTALGLQMALANAKAGTPTAVFSLDLSIGKTKIHFRKKWIDECACADGCR